MEIDSSFWCYNCKSKCIVYEDDNDTPHCERCNSNFIEELEPGSNPQSFTQPQQNNPRGLVVTIRNNTIHINNNLQTLFDPFSSFLQRNTNDRAFENLLNFIMQNDPNRYGNPPASIKVVAELPRYKVCEKGQECAICMDSLQLDDIAIRLKCDHPYHEKCLLDWLGMHNTCPVCRYELVTDDKDYENRKNQSRNIMRSYNNN
jgi:E3 ubiquitin-protein ligase RNF115/126